MEKMKTNPKPKDVLQQFSCLTQVKVFCWCWCSLTWPWTNTSCRRQVTAAGVTTSEEWSEPTRG